MRPPPIHPRRGSHPGRTEQGGTPSDWEAKIEDVAAELDEATAKGLNWLPAVRQCWAHGLTEQESRETCMAARYPHVVGPVLSAMNAIRETP